MDEFIIRENLSRRVKGKIPIDMPEIYRRLDSGCGMDNVCEDFHVSIRTLYRRHKEYQEMAAAAATERERRKEEEKTKAAAEKEKEKEKEKQKEMVETPWGWIEKDPDGPFPYPDE